MKVRKMNFKRKACVLFSLKRGQETPFKSLLDRGNSKSSPNRIYKNSLQAGKLKWKHKVVIRRCSTYCGTNNKKQCLTASNLN